MLGLVGMTLHVIGRRMHEIGVRKTLGASFPRVLAMLLRDCTRPILIANIVAWPLAYLAMKAYLSIFAQRVELSLTPFLLSLVITLCIAWLAIAAQTTRAARVNPATVLRYE